MQPLSTTRVEWQSSTVCNYNGDSPELNGELRQVEQSLIQAPNPMEMGRWVLGPPSCPQARPMLLALRVFLLAILDLQEWYFGNHTEDTD